MIPPPVFHAALVKSLCFQPSGTAITFLQEECTVSNPLILGWNYFWKCCALNCWRTTYSASSYTGTGTLIHTWGEGGWGKAQDKLSSLRFFLLIKILFREKSSIQSFSFNSINKLYWCYCSILHASQNNTPFIQLIWLFIRHHMD